MKIIKNLLTPEQVHHFKNYWKNNPEKIYVNWSDGDQIVDNRLSITPGSEEYILIEKLMRQEFPTHKNLWTALQEQSFSHNIHIDDYLADQENVDNQIWTCVFALDTIPEFKTFVWKETAFDNKELHQWVANWGDNKQSMNRKSNISVTHDLEHTFDPNQNDYIADYLELDGIFTYSAGDAVLFNAKQFHCTSNWTKYPQHKMRRLLQVHLSTN
jgi:hypothetical protein